MLHRLGFSQVKIAQALKVSRKAVQTALRGSARLRCGRKRVTTAYDDRVMKKAVTKDPHTASALVAAQLREAGVSVSSRTVRRRLQKEFKLTARRPAKKPLLSEKQRKARLAFCKAHVNKPAEWWDRVMFSDESTFKQVRGSGSNYVRRPSGLRLDPKYTMKTVKHPPCVMAWGAITAKGRAGLHIFSKGTKVNTEEYLKVVQQKVPVHMSISQTTLFQQDGAPCHTSRKAKEWFTRNDVELLPNWPSSSPDLNVIENCWSLMKKRVAAHHPTSEESLQAIIKHVWTHEVTSEYCHNLIRSMPSRLQAVIKNNGLPTKY